MLTYQACPGGCAAVSYRHMVHGTQAAGSCGCSSCHSYSMPMPPQALTATSILTQHAHRDSPQVSTVRNGAHVCRQASGTS